jgi:hypothetical protein
VPSDKTVALEQAFTDLLTIGTDDWQYLTTFASGWTLGSNGYFAYRLLLWPVMIVAVKNLQVPSGGWTDGGTIITAANGFPDDYLVDRFLRFTVTTSITKSVTGSYGMATLELAGDGSVNAYGMAAGARVDGCFAVPLSFAITQPPPPPSGPIEDEALAAILDQAGSTITDE